MSAMFQIQLAGQTVPLQFQTVSFGGIRQIVESDLLVDINSRVSSAALAASDGTGGLLVKIKRAEMDAVARTLDAVFQDDPATPYDFGALPPVEGTNNTDALQKWLDSGPNLFLPEGVWLGRNLVVGNTGLPVGRQFRGEGPTRSILYSDETSGAVLSFDINEPIQHILIEDIGVKGAGLTGTLNGIDFGSTFDYSFQSVIRRVEGTELGGSIIKDGLNSIGESTFSLTMADITGYSKDHNIYLGGGPAVTIFGGFIFGGGSDWLNGAGVRILQGNCILIGYNGPEKDWGAIFGASVAEDGVYKLCQPTLIGCSIENNRIGGVWSKTAGPNMIGNKIVCRWANFVAVKTGAVATNLGWIDNIDAAFPIVDRPSQPPASLSQGCSVHFTGTFPFHTVLNGSTTTFYETGDPAVTTVFPGAGLKRLAYAQYGPVVPARTADSQLTSTGVNASNALPLTAQINQVLTVGASTGVRLPPSFAGVGPIEIYNDSGTALLVWPPESSATIDATGAGLSVTLSAGARCAYRCIEGNSGIGLAGKWRSTLLGAVSA